MIDPRRCDACGSDTELQDACYDLTIGAHTLAIDHRGRLCRGCARRVLRRRPRHPDDPSARLRVEVLLGHHFGEPVKLLWLQLGEHRGHPVADGPKTTPSRKARAVVGCSATTALLSGVERDP